MRSSIVAASLCAACVGFAGTAFAEGESADALFQEGLKLFDAGKTHEACERFQASYKLDPALGTLQNLATCHEAEGRTARAHVEFRDLADLAAKAGLGQKARENLGRQRAATLAKKLSKIELRLGAGANVTEIRVDDAPLEASLWSAPLALDPGPRRFAFSAPGKVAQTQVVEVSATPGTAPLDVPKLSDVPPPAPPPPKGMPSMRIAGIGVAAGGALGLVLSAVFGGLTFAKKSAASAHCMGAYCDPQGLSLQNAAHGFASASTATFVIGLAAVGTGAFLFVWGGRPSARALRVSPVVGAYRGGLRFDGLE